MQSAVSNAHVNLCVCFLSRYTTFVCKMRHLDLSVSGLTGPSLKVD